MFTNVGVAGVWAGIAVIVLLVVAGEASIRIRAAPAGHSGLVVLLGGAAIGTLIGRSEGWRVEVASTESGSASSASASRRSRRQEARLGAPGSSRPGWWMSLAAIGLTVVTAVLAVAFVLPQPGAVRRRAPPNWTTPSTWPPPSPGCSRSRGRDHGPGLRRWIAALISLVTNPIALLAILASTCAFY